LPGLSIREKLLHLKKTQRWLVKELRENGFPSLYEPKFSRILDGDHYSDSEEILKTAIAILDREKAPNG
jgi:hypothetical protein